MSSVTKISATREMIVTAVEKGWLKPKDAMERFKKGLIVPKDFEVDKFIVDMGWVQKETNPFAPQAGDAQKKNPFYKPNAKKGNGKSMYAQDPATGKWKYAGQQAPCGPVDDPEKTHLLRIAALEDVIPGISKEPGVKFESIGVKDPKGKTNREKYSHPNRWGEMTNVPCMWIKLPDPATHPTICGKKHSDVRNILKANGYGYASSSEKWMSDSKGNPCRRGHTDPRGVGKTWD